MRPAQLTLGYMCGEALSPLDLLDAAAGAGFSAVGPRITGRYLTDPDMGIVGNKAMIAAIVRRSRDLGLRVSNISTYYMRGDVTLADLAPVIEATAELGSDLIVANCHDPDYCRYLANLAAYCAAAAPYGIRLVVECMPYTEVKSIDQALAIIAAVDQPNLGFLPDPLHLRTCGIAPSEIAKVDPARIFFAQICDAPLATPADIAGIIDEARTGRLLPGEGELPLADYLAALPARVEIECEIPSRRLAHLPPPERMRTIFDATVRFIDTAARRHNDTMA